MSTPKRILVIKLSSFGDLFHALPAVHNLKVALGAAVDWVTQPEYVDLVRCFTPVSEVLAFPRRSLAGGFTSFVRRLRQERYDYIVDLQGLLKSGVVARLARGGVRIGPSFHREGAGWLYDVVAGPRNKGRHAVEENLDAVRFLGLPLMPVAFPLVFPRRAVDSGRPRVALVPFSRRGNKNWSVPGFVEVGRRLAVERRATLYLFGGPGDQAACEMMRQELLAGPGVPEVINLAGQTSLVAMGGWFQEMDLVVVNDSGPLHLAAALGCPLVTPFGPTDPLRTGPYGSGHTVLVAEVECRPCYARMCRKESLECMDRITAGEVFDACLAQLDRRS